MLSWGWVKVNECIQVGVAGSRGLGAVFQRSHAVNAHFLNMGFLFCFDCVTDDSFKHLIGTVRTKSIHIPVGVAGIGNRKRGVGALFQGRIGGQRIFPTEGSRAYCLGIKHDDYYYKEGFD